MKDFFNRKNVVVLLFCGIMVLAALQSGRMQKHYSSEQRDSVQLENEDASVLTQQENTAQGVALSSATNSLHKKMK